MRTRITMLSPLALTADQCFSSLIFHFRLFYYTINGRFFRLSTRYYLIPSFNHYFINMPPKGKNIGRATNKEKRSTKNKQKKKV